MTPPVALTIAGSDSSGGAGVQADLKSFAALGVYGASAITALTAQNTVGVREVHTVPAEFVVAQVEAVLDDLTVGAVKTGMLATASIVRAVAALAATGRLPLLVVDPVMVASSGDRLLESSAERLYREALLPHAFVATPNVHEAEVLLGQRIRTLDEQHQAARALGGLGTRNVVVTGGHRVTGTGDDDEVVDVVWDGHTTYELRGGWVETDNSHGSGCTYASAITAGLARGLDVGAALLSAKTYVFEALTAGADWQLGAGHGPLAHFGHAGA